MVIPLKRVFLTSFPGSYLFPLEEIGPWERDEEATFSLPLLTKWLPKRLSDLSRLDSNKKGFQVKGKDSTRNMPFFLRKMPFLHSCHNPDFHKNPNKLSLKS